MQIVVADRTVTLDHTPGMHWMLGGLFVVVGLLCCVASLGLGADEAAVATWERLGAMAMGFGAVVAGGWVCWRAPMTHVHIDLRDGRGRVERRGLGLRETIQFPVDGVVAVVLDQGHDDEGGDVFRPALLMRDGTHVLLSPVWLSHGPQEAAQRLARALDRPLSRQALPR